MRKILLNNVEVDVTATKDELSDSAMKIIEKELNKLYSTLTGSLMEDMETRDSIRELEKMLNPNKYGGCEGGECTSCGS